jgi:hypothetical protein
MMNNRKSLKVFSSKTNYLIHQVHLELAESDFVNFLNIPTVKAILKAYPDILVRFGPKGMKFVSSLLQKPGKT